MSDTSEVNGQEQLPSKLMYFQSKLENTEAEYHNEELESRKRFKLLSVIKDKQDGAYKVLHDVQSQVSKLERQVREVNRKMNQLFRYQQYRDEPEWQDQLKDLYMKERERLWELVKELNTKDEHYTELRFRLQVINEQYEQQTEQLELNKQRMLQLSMLCYDLRQMVKKLESQEQSEMC